MTTNNASMFSLKNRWQGMLQRCNNPKNPAYKNYGGRGISVCERWYSFANFYIDMGECPEGLTLERKDNDGNYCLENCCWATQKEQGKNKRRPVKNTGPTRTLNVNGLPSGLVAEAKASAATAKIPLKAWIKEAVREKLDHDKRRN